MSRHVRVDRRRFLARASAGALAALTRPDLLLAGSGSTQPAQTQSARPGRVAELAAALGDAPDERAFDVAVEAIRAGARREDVLGAVLLAGVQEVSPRPPGTKYHVVLVVPSAWALSQRGKAAERWLPVLFNVDVLKWAQRRDRQEGDWELPPAPAPLTDDPARAAAALTAALEQWDDAAADRAAVAASRLLDPDALFELLWPFGARDFLNIGHQSIHAAQIHRALALTERPLREPVVRSLVHGLLLRSPGSQTAAYRRSLERRAELPVRWAEGRPDPEVSVDLLRRLRTMTWQQALDATVEHLKRGVAPASIWDGLRLAAAEMLYRLRGSKVANAQLLAVHPTTILNALHYASGGTARDDTRRLLLLQAAAWMPLARDVLAEAKGLSMEGPGIDALAAPADRVELGAALAGARARPELVLGLDGADVEPLLAAVTSLVHRKAVEHHNHKYAAALLEEYPKTHPRWAPTLLVPVLTYLPVPAQPDSDVHRRIEAAFARAGVDPARG